MIAAVLLVLVQVAYFAYYAAGITAVRVGRRRGLLLLRERRPAHRDDPVALVRRGRRGALPEGCLDRCREVRRVACGAWTSS